MRPEDFVEALRERILLENRAIYSDLLEHTAPEDATDPNWRTVLSIYRQLGAEEQERLIGFIVQIITDTLSNVFAVLDGKIWLSMQEDDFTLTCGESKLNGDLQDTFLAAEEENKGDLGSEGDLGSGAISGQGRSRVRRSRVRASLVISGANGNTKRPRDLQYRARSML